MENPVEKRLAAQLLLCSPTAMQTKPKVGQPADSPALSNFELLLQAEIKAKGISVQEAYTLLQVKAFCTAKPDGRFAGLLVELLTGDNSPTMENRETYATE